MSAETSQHQLPVNLPILPVRNTVLFPYMTLPLSIGRPKSLQLMSDIMDSGGYMGIVAQIDGNVDEPGDADLFRFGTVAKVLKATDISHGAASVLVQGISRFRMEEMLQQEPYHLARVSYIQESLSEGQDLEIQALYRNLKQIVHKVIHLTPSIPDEAEFLIEKIPSPSYLADMVAHYLDIDIKEKQELLEFTDLEGRLKRATEILTRELEVLELGNKIQSEVKDRIDSHQREVYLREQMKAIQKELGESDGQSSEIEKLRKAIEDVGMPEEAYEGSMKELKRLSQMHTSSPEYHVVRTYLDWMVELPWSAATEDNLDIREAERVLNEDHFDLKKVKRRILEFLAIRKLKADMKGPILCLQGPPGVGKTSLGKSIARALGREFHRISLGGVHDEAEIRGHRRTYIGALPGRIIAGMKKTGTNNPVFMLDEIEKLGKDMRGDPSSALLEVLDPEQNNAFSDHYLGVPFDLSNVMFIATANLLDTVSPPLRDRMEIISIPGYTDEEKLEIARTYLVPQNLEEHGLRSDQLDFTDDSLLFIIHGYTKEAGVRNLKREIASICRFVGKEIAYGKEEKTDIVEATVEEILGQPRFESDVAERTSRTGVATGLAWTPFGGDILFVEATMMRGKGGLTLTGQLGDVMKESAQAALSFIRSNAKKLGLDEDIFQKNDVHIHVPSGAIPKDGPSAGVTMMTALTSLLTQQPVKNDVAMTGEITLRGTVLPVGGVKEKVLAAKRAGIKTVLLPEKNKKDLDDISESSRKEMNFIFTREMLDVLKYSFDTSAS